MRRASALLFALMTAVPGAAQFPSPQPGESYEARRTYKTKEVSTNGSGESSGTDTIRVRVIGVSSVGIEREYDLAPDAKADERSRQWQLPVRILTAADGSERIVNVADLESRLTDWLKRGKMTRAACGRWIFTWNAFKIECDPQSVLAMIAEFTIDPPVVHEGLLYSDVSALAPVPLKRIAPDRYVARLSVNPDALKRAEAENAKITAQILGPTIAPMPTMRQAGGTIEVVFDTDHENRPLRRTRTMMLDVVLSDGTTERRQSVESLEKIATDRPNTRLRSIR